MSFYRSLVLANLLTSYLIRDEMFRDPLWGEALIQVRKVTTKLNGTLEGEKKKTFTVGIL